MKIQNITDVSFIPYGRVVSGFDFSGLLKEMEHTVKPLDEVIYVPSDEKLESLDAAAYLQDTVYGGLPVQIGYCNGNNYMLNALEYHRDSEVDIAATDLILLLGMEQDIVNNQYDTAKVEAFFVPAGTAVEVYGTTLHYAPCNANENGFRCVIILPKNTNTDLEKREPKTEEDKLLFARNKWMLAHPDAAEPGMFVGLVGENLSVK